MTDTAATTPAETRPDAGLPGIATALSGAQINAKLLKLSKRGKLPGFREGGRGLFEAEAHGTTFDFVLVASLRDGDSPPASSPGMASHTASGGEVRFSLRPALKTPILFAGVTLFAAGPGLYLTHSMLETYFSWYPKGLWLTAAWYVPLTVLPLPWMMWRMWLKSKSAARDHALETIELIRGELA